MTSSATFAAPDAGGSIRVGGSEAAAVTGANGDFRSGPCRIDTSLPDGYPMPTPPGAIELKTYPPIRLAEVSGTGNPDRGMNNAFWPLFNHIKRHDIPMTSPVEMSYSGLNSPTSNPDSWRMAFLYRTPDANAVGREGNVTVRDAQGLTVVSVGLKGDYSMSLVRRGVGELEQWLADHPDWRIAGDWRVLYYNGPALFFWNKWAEVQAPVVRVTDAPGPAASSSK